MGSGRRLLSKGPLPGRAFTATIILLIGVATGTALAAAMLADLFDDTSSRSGITSILHNSATPEKHQIETMAGGLAVIDFDNDGHPDLFLTNGAPEPSLRKSGPEWWNRLYRNRGDGTFEDVTAKSGLQGDCFSIGAAVADFDNDGWPDLFVAGVDCNRLYRNRHDGTFEDVTKKAQIPQTGFAVGGAFFDADADGWNDLLIVNYVQWSPATEPFCGDRPAGIRTYCHPRFYEPVPNTLLRNNGDGTFTDVSLESGIGAYAGKGMGAAIGDIDGDGRIDVVVTNDTARNFLFHNEGGMRFREVGMEAGIALNEDGRALSSMGVDFRDVDNDGRDDLMMTALANETYPYYRNIGGSLFKDLTYRSRLGAQTLALTGWGVGVYDFDNDGRKDIFTANGDVNDNTELFSSRESKQRCTVFWQRKANRFEAQAVDKPAWHRGAAFADFDGDGQVDIAVARLNATPELLLNRTGAGRHWIAFLLRGTRSNRDGIGAHLHLTAASGEQWNRVTTAVGYASSSERVVRFGLGSDTRVRRVEIEWPSGTEQSLDDLPADQMVKVQESAQP